MLQHIKKFLKILQEDKKLQKFLLVGVVNTIFGYSIYAFFLFVGFNFNLAAFLATIIGVLFNFKTSSKFVFKNNSNKLLFKFVLSYVLIYILNIVSLNIFNFLNFNMYLAGFITVGYLSLVSFFLQKNFVFNQKNRIKWKKLVL